MSQGPNTLWDIIIHGHKSVGIKWQLMSSKTIVKISVIKKKIIKNHICKGV